MTLLLLVLVLLFALVAALAVLWPATSIMDEVFKLSDQEPEPELTGVGR